MTSPFRFEWSPEFLEFGRYAEKWIDGESMQVWIPHCPQHPGFPKPCTVCEAAPLGPDDGSEA